jgi:hypothetical protein
MPYTLWMAQRVLDAYYEMPAIEQLSLTNWLQSLGGSELLDLKIPRLQRIGLRVVAA